MRPFILPPFPFADALRAALCDGALFAGLAAQSYDPKGSGGIFDFEPTDRQLAHGKKHRPVLLARCRILELPDGPALWGTLALSYGPKRLDDRHDSKFDERIAPLLRFCDTVQAEAVRRWIAAERTRLLERAAAETREALTDTLFVLPRTADALRPIANQVIREAKREVMYGDEHTLGAIKQARDFLSAAELAYQKAHRLGADAEWDEGPDAAGGSRK